MCKLEHETFNEAITVCLVNANCVNANCFYLEFTAAVAALFIAAFNRFDTEKLDSRQRLVRVLVCVSGVGARRCWFLPFLTAVFQVVEDIKKHLKKKKHLSERWCYHLNKDSNL